RAAADRGDRPHRRAVRQGRPHQYPGTGLAAAGGGSGGQAVGRRDDRGRGRRRAADAQRAALPAPAARRRRGGGDADQQGHGAAVALGLDHRGAAHRAAAREPRLHAEPHGLSPRRDPGRPRQGAAERALRRRHPRPPRQPPRPGAGAGRRPAAGRLRNRERRAGGRRRRLCLAEGPDDAGVQRGPRRPLRRRARPQRQHPGLYPRLCRAGGDAGRLRLSGAGRGGHVRSRDRRPHGDRHPRRLAAMRRRLCGIAAAAALALALALAAGYLALPPPALDRARLLSALVVARDGSILRGFLSADGKWRLPVEPEAVDPLYRRMLIAAEDRHFALHPGVDPAAAVRAAAQFAWRGHVVSGASTLTMQAVRLLERRPRTLAAKLAEMGEALALDRRLGKDGVLALYLTLAPFGGNLEGVRAASLAYFGKEPRLLSPAEAALLVAIPRAPERLRPDRHPEAARRARDAVLRRMAGLGLVAPESLAEAIAEPVPARRLAMPFHAPHLAHDLVAADPFTARIATTIDPLLQRQVEALLKREAAALDPQATLAALVIDNRRRAVVAYVGNADFAAAARHGTLDMARGLRSPGSALKPFIYAMAFDRLILHPETLVEDRPSRFGDYAPTDFDGNFLGTVSAREALQYSLNVPAVAVLDRLGAGRFAAALAAAGIGLKLPASGAEPGLATALGGAGITLADLATLYTALSHDGRVAPLRYREDQPPGRETALFGPAAAWYVNDILANAPPPPGVPPAEFRRGRRLA